MLLKHSYQIILSLITYGLRNLWRSQTKACKDIARFSSEIYRSPSSVLWSENDRFAVLGSDALALDPHDVGGHVSSKRPDTSASAMPNKLRPTLRPQENSVPHRIRNTAVPALVRAGQILWKKRISPDGCDPGRANNCHRRIGLLACAPARLPDGRK